MRNLRTKILEAAKKGKGLPIGYHCNSFGHDQIEYSIKLYYGLTTEAEKKYFEKIMIKFLNSKSYNLRWVAYVVVETLNFLSAKRIVDDLIKRNKIDERNRYVCPIIVKEMKKAFKSGH